MLGEERRQQILRRLKERGSIQVTELSALFQVTEETIRRDLERLESQGYLRRTYGGAVKVENEDHDTAFYTRNLHNRLEKQAIGAKAADLVVPGDVITIDASTTALQLVPHLKNKQDIVVITNAIKVATLLAGSPNVHVILAGGTLHFKTLSLIGPHAEAIIGHYNSKKAFISCKGVAADGGVTETNEIQARIKTQMIKSAKETILLADYEKVGEVAYVPVVPLADIAKVITDSKASPAELERIRKAGPEVIVAEPVGTEMLIGRSEPVPASQ